MIVLLIEKNYDIGVKILKEFELSYPILSNNKISFFMSYRFTRFHKI